MGALGADSCRANPVVIDIDAALHDCIDHSRSTHFVVVDVHASFFPRVDHLVLTKPLTSEHHAIVGSLVKVKNVLKAEFDSIVLSAQG